VVVAEKNLPTTEPVSQIKAKAVIGAKQRGGREPYHIIK